MAKILKSFFSLLVINSCMLIHKSITIGNNFVLCFFDNIAVNLIYICAFWQIIMTQTEVVEKVIETKLIFSYRE